jgi:DNA-binding winged helix-turn-helix (wHTH) protein
VRIRFGSFVLDRETRLLTRDGAAVHLTPKAFELLTTLVEQRPRVLSKASLLSSLWPATFVAEANLSNLVVEIRAALGDTARKPKWIRTAHGFGYAFSGAASSVRVARGTAAERPACWLEWGQQRFPLPLGEHVVGRDQDVEVRIDAATVSRRHARVVVTHEGVSLEDFGSKNGTRRGGIRVTSSVQIADGDAIHFGSVLLTFHVRTQETTTVTQAGRRSEPV